MGRKRRVPDPRVDPHEVDETEPCESCRIDLMILRRAHELQAEQGHARNIAESLEQEQELERMWRRRARRPKRVAAAQPGPSKALLQHVREREGLEGETLLERARELERELDTLVRLWRRGS
jgi:hypothetical protein